MFKGMRTDSIISFSIDDVIESLLWLERTKAKTVFDSHTYAFSRWLYEEYNISTTCNCLYSDGVNNLSMISDNFKEEFSAHSDWLKFSFHGWDFEKDYSNVSYEEAFNDIRIVENELIRICGNESISKVVRTHFFSGNDEAVKAWSDYGVKELLTADDDRQNNYNLSNEEIDELRRHSILKNGLLFTKTNIRLERYNEITHPIKTIKYRDRIVVFTHEKYIHEKWMKKVISDLMNCEML